MTFDDGSISDESLAAEAARGSIEAFDRLARRYQVPLVRFISRRFSRQIDAEDVVQETLVRSYSAIGSFDPDRSFQAWIFAIAYRQAVTAERKRAVRRAASLAQDDYLPAAPEQHADDGDGPGELWTLARRLPTPEQNAALWLVHVEGVPIVEVAHVIGKTPGAVKVMVHRARERVRDAWLRSSEARHATR